jgi:uncharacterized protein (TIGR03437 family)
MSRSWGRTPKKKDGHASRYAPGKESHQKATYWALTAGYFCIISQTVVAQSLIVTSAASYSPNPIAAGSIVSMFAPEIATGKFTAINPPPAPLPVSLGGVSVTFYSGILQLPISLVAVTPTQVNAIMPNLFAYGGAASITLTTSSGVEFTTDISMAWTSPAIFTADESGSGAPAAQFVLAHADGSQTFLGSVSNCEGNTCTPLPVSLGDETDTAVLELFATGISGVFDYCNPGQPICSVQEPVPPVIVTAMQSSAPYAVIIQSLPVLYYGPQGGFGNKDSFYGLDQINVELPHSLTGSGLVNLSVFLPGDPGWQYANGFVIGQPIQSNIVTIDIQ